MNRPTIPSSADPLIKQFSSQELVPSNIPDGLCAESQRPPKENAIALLTEELANLLNINPAELTNWIDLHTSIPNEVVVCALRLAKRYGLNPLLHQVAIDRDEEGAWHVYIPIDGWIELIWRQKGLTGITFKEGPVTESGLPLWMQCSIYRSDLQRPITVREYLSEVQTHHPMWVEMPRRMLRHKTLQQCARLAFGIAEQPQVSMPLSEIQTETLSRSNAKAIQNPKLVLRNRLQELNRAITSEPIKANALYPTQAS